jgi:flagellar M-ring protein FliF
MALIQSMSTRGKLTLAGCALAFLAVAILIVKMAGAPSYSTVMTGLDPTKSSQVTAALDAQGIGWELQNGGTALGVEKGKASAARIALASKGLNSATTMQPGFEILDKQKLGASSQQQQIAYQRGLEGEIANTISQIAGAGGSQVRLTLPKDDLFADTARSATAAVLLGGSAATMDPGAVRGIANLVAASVPGLKTSSVTITDSAGQMLWPSGDGSSGTDASGGGLSKPAAEARYDAQLESSLNALLTRTLGPDKAQVQVHSDLNVDKTNEETLTYGKTGVPLTEKKQTETLKGQGAAAGGTSGAASNIPTYAGGGAAGASGNSNYKQSTTERTLGVDKKVSRTQKAMGAVNRLDIGLVVDKNAKMAPADLAALQKTIASAAGLQTARGDSMNVSQVAFAKVAAVKAPGSALPIPPAFAGILKGLGIGIGALAFLFFITRHLRRREQEALADEPSWLKQLEAPRPVMEMPAGIGAGEPTVVMESVATQDPRRQALEHVIATEPERVAAHLRTWITEDNK